MALRGNLGDIIMRNNFIREYKHRIDAYCMDIIYNSNIYSSKLEIEYNDEMHSVLFSRICLGVYHSNKFTDVGYFI